jgi:hypothetical protein
MHTDILAASRTDYGEESTGIRTWNECLTHVRSARAAAHENHR